MRIADDVAWVRSSSEARDYCLVAKVPSQMPLELKGSAIYLWECWAAGMDFEESVTVLAEMFSEDPQTVRTQASQTYQHLLDHGLLVEDPAGDCAAD
ncbi:hypothetical protein [uncultured Kocuria sp.]|uniref:hypothetical protein n=1 Tax=uncultured Kocuria sp. TaxID=259305 RepID=UPI00259A8ECC|nr:hypothetical protein [uncultured Kocuria sp.]MCT1366522.1 hypothetical protein [Rothia sp. p3-SID1597]